MNQNGSICGGEADHHEKSNDVKEMKFHVG